MPRETIVIRAAQQTDLPQLVSAEQVCFSDPWEEAAFTAFLSGGAFGTYVACDAAGTVCGYLCTVSCPPEYEIGNIAVLPAFRRAGVGQALLSFALETAKGQGAEDVYLEVRASNVPAQGLYEKNGFVRIGIRRNYYKSPTEDAVLMKKTLV